ncbi:MAG: hypothetical protein JOY93_00115 [Acidobacteriales bacterium]|nr:hypothetical protein [Terriglobales bacterium]
MDAVREGMEFVAGGAKSSELARNAKRWATRHWSVMCVAQLSRGLLGMILAGWPVTHSSAKGADEWGTRPQITLFEVD